MDGQNHVHRTMHILDVISSVSGSSKCTKIVGGWGFAPDPIKKAYSAAPDPQLGLRDPLEGKGWGKEGRR